jgi:Ran GTPase-activating protein (RanGAP) involved in mRNA processing and transport
MAPSLNLDARQKHFQGIAVICHLCAPSVACPNVRWVLGRRYPRYALSRSRIDSGTQIGSGVPITLQMDLQDLLHTRRDRRHGISYYTDMPHVRGCFLVTRQKTLYGRQVGDEGAVTLAGELATNTTREAFDLTKNKIGDAGAVALAGALATDETLKVLWLWGNRIGDDGIKALGQALVQNGSLESLNVSKNKFGIVGLKSLAAGLKSNNRLTELRLGFGSVTNKGAVILADALARNTSLTKLCLVRNSIGGEGAVALGEALKVNASLVHLSLWGNSIGNKGAVAIAEALAVNTTLQELSLGYSKCWSSIGNKGAVAIADALAVNTTLRELSLGHDRWNTSFRSNGDAGTVAFLKALAEHNTTLTGLGLCTATAAGRLAVAAFVAANRAGIRLLHAGAKLDLSSKSIDASLAKPVATDLAGNTTVTMLILNQNDIGRQGCVDIADALIKNCVLTTIEMNDNSIGDDGSTALAAMLRQNTTLTKISLHGNDIGPTGAIALSEMLRMNTSLRELGVGRNHVGDDGAAAVAEALRCNETLERLDFSCNSISDKGATAMLKVLQNYNCTLTWLNLEDNAEVSPVLLEALVSHRILNSFLKHLRNPLEEIAFPLAIHAAVRGSIAHEEAELPPCHNAAGEAGFVFHLVKAVALKDSKIVKSR